MIVFKNQEKMPESCPPSDAIPEDVEPVYRFIEGETIESIDFCNHVEREKPYPPHKKCEALALSFFTSERAAKKAKRFKNLRNKKFVEGRITSDCGIHTIENEHLNLWVYKDINILNVFSGGEVKGEAN